jgi:hypothetical protein
MLRLFVSAFVALVLAVGFGFAKEWKDVEFVKFDKQSNELTIKIDGKETTVQVEKGAKGFEILAKVAAGAKLTLEGEEKDGKITIKSITGRNKD